MQLKLSQIGKGKSFIFNDATFNVLEVTEKDGVLVRRLHDNHLFNLPANTEVGQIGEKVIKDLRDIK